MTEAPPALEMRGIVKRFPGVVACDGVDFSVRAGEIHALLGENGAGKSTLVSVLGGLYRPDAGALRLGGRAATFRTPREAIEAGVGMVHQQFMLVPTQTVAENVVLGLREPRLVLRPRELERRVARAAREHGLAVEPGALVWQLSVGEQQRVEILKALYRGARILVLDEPTPVLVPEEVNELFRSMRALAAAGRSVVFIAHKLQEVLAVADRITVLRRGKVVAAGLDARTASADELARLMVGEAGSAPAREGTATASERVSPSGPGAGAGDVTALEVRALSAAGDRGQAALRGVSFTVRAGEIYAIAGVAGNGQRELAEALTGLRTPTGGSIAVAGRDLTGRPPLAYVRAGVGHVPEDRRGTGTIPRMSVAENLALKAYREPPLRARWRLDRRALAQRAAALARDYGIRAASPDVAAGTLSGGNLQRVILARELSARPKVLVAAYPTRGLDVGATEAVHRLLQRQRDEGAAIVLVSADLDEILALATRVGVLHGGRLAGEIEPAAAGARARIGAWMAGGDAKAEAGA